MSMLNRHYSPRRCKDFGKWNALIERYPDLSANDLAALNNHIEQAHCTVCKAKLAQLTDATNRLIEVAPLLKSEIDQQILREADAVKDAIKTNVLAHWDAVIAGQPNGSTHPYPSPLPTGSGPVEGDSMWHGRSRYLKEGFAALVQMDLADPFARIVMLLRQLLAQVVAFAIAVCGTVLIWLSPLARLAGETRNWRFIPARRRMILATPAALFIASIVVGCGLATLLLRSLLFHGPVRWWHLALVTGTTTALACSVLVVGILIAGHHALHGHGWDLGKLGNLVFAQKSGSGHQDQYVTLLQLYLSSVGIDNYETAFALTHKDQSHGHGEDELTMQMARFGMALCDMSNEMSDARQISLKEFHRAWCAAFRHEADVPDVPVSAQHWGEPVSSNRRLNSDSLLSEYLAETLQSEVGTLDKGVVRCRWSAATADGPAVLVCATSSTDTSKDTPYETTNAPNHYDEENDNSTSSIALDADTASCAVHHKSHAAAPTRQKQEVRQEDQTDLMSGNDPGKLVVARLSGIEALPAKEPAEQCGAKGRWHVIRFLLRSMVWVPQKFMIAIMTMTMIL